MMRRQPLSWRWLIPVASLALLLTACQAGSRTAGPTPPAGDVSVRVEVTPLQAPTFSSASDQLPVTRVVAATPAPAATVTPAAPSASDFSAQVVTAWFDLADLVVRDEKLPPSLASRLFAYAGVALWEAIAPGAPDSTSLAGQLIPPAALSPDRVLFASFQALADEAAISRLNGGIHFRSATEAGQEQGACIAKRVNSLRVHQY